LEINFEFFFIYQNASILVNVKIHFQTLNSTKRWAIESLYGPCVWEQECPLAGGVVGVS
jgi:hypothetical protein